MDDSGIHTGLRVFLVSRSLVVNGVAAALIDHHLRQHGQDLSLLPQAIHRIEVAGRPGMERKGRGRISFTNDTGTTRNIPELTITTFRLGDGGTLHMPPMIGSICDDEDGDLVLLVREMAITDSVFYNMIDAGLRIILTRRLPETLVDAAAGRPLADYVSHPALHLLPLVIDTAYNLPDGFSLNIMERPSMGAALRLRPSGKTILPGETILPI